MSVLDELADFDRENLILSPIAVIDLVGKADGKLERKEIQQAVEVIRNTHNRADPFMGEIYSATLEKIDTLLDHYRQQALNCDQVIDESRKAIEQNLPQYLVTFQQALYNLGYEIADASGMIPIGNVNVPEEKALARLKAHLYVHTL